LDFLEESKKRRWFARINYGRLALLILLLLVSLSIQVFLTPPFLIIPFVIALAGGLLLALLSILFLKLFSFRFTLFYQLVGDITLISVLVFLSGGIESPFYFLYIFPIIEAALFLDKRDTIYTAALSYIIFGALSELMYLKIVPFDPFLTEETVINKGTFIYNLLMGLVAFTGVAFISNYYFDKMSKARAELEHIEESLKELDVLNNIVLEKMENGFLICNAEGLPISYNEKSRTLLKFTVKNNIFELLFKEQDYSELDKVSQAKIGKYYFEKEIKQVFLGISVSLIRNIYSFDKVFVFIITDLTEKKAIEKKLKEKEHFALIGEMSASIAHEIRNPLASISGSVQFLEREMKMDPEYLNLMDIIVKESRRLSQSIEEFLDFSRITPSQLSNFRLSELLDVIIGIATLNHPGIDFIRKYSGDDLIDADRGKMEQVAWNLINNAVKAVSGKGHIEIDIYENEGDIYFSVKDDGIGIDKKDMAHIFTPFYSRFTSGIGLGMAIVKRIVDEHNFDITIKSEKNLGTEVILCCKKT